MREERRGEENANAREMERGDGRGEIADLCGSRACVREKKMRERSGEKDEVRTETEEADKASSSLVAKCPRLSPTASTPQRAPGATTGLRAAASPLLPPAAGGAPRARPPRLPGRRPARPERWEGGSSERASERGREGLPVGGNHVVPAHSISTPPLSFFTPFSFQTGKSVPRSGRVFPPRLFPADPGPRSRPSASWWGERWKPVCARCGDPGAGRGAWGRSRAGTWLQPPRAHPEAPRPARPRSVG